MTASGDPWVKVNKGSKVKHCDHYNIESMRCSSLKLDNVIVCLNILVEFDLQHQVTFGSRSTRGQRSNFVNVIALKVSGPGVSNFAT